MTDHFREHIDGRALGTFTAAELQAMQFPPIRWVVPDVLPEGLTILAGKPKLGKSWLALDMALAVANGGSVLGRECEQGAALYLALEDNQRRLQRRLGRVEPHGPWPEALEMHTRWPRFDADGLDRIRTWIKSREGARLVIVDTLAVVRPAQRAPETAHSNDYAALRGLHQLASAEGMAVLVIHHLRKSDAEDALDTVSGSTGLTGAADTTLILTRRESEGGCILYGRGRDLEEFEAGLEFDRFACRWRDLGDPAQAFASDTRAAIFAAIKAGNTVAGQIIRETGLGDDLVYQTLRRMVRAGDLRKDGRGLYSLPLDPLSEASECQKGGTNPDNLTDLTGVSKANGPEPDAYDPEAWA